MLPVLIQSVGDGRRRRLADDPLHLEARQFPGPLRRPPSGIVKIGRHADHRLRHLFPEIVFRILLQRPEHKGGEFLSQKAFMTQMKLLPASHITFKDAGRTLRMEQSAFHRRVPHINLIFPTFRRTNVRGSLRIHTDYGRRQTPPQPVRNDLRPLICIISRQAVGRSQIDSNDHFFLSTFFCKLSSAHITAIEWGFSRTASRYMRSAFS